MSNVEKVGKELFKLSNNYVLKHITKFSYKDKMNMRKGYHQVVIYPSNNYIADRVGELKNINIYFKSYLMLECIDSTIPWEKRESIMITENTIHKLIKALKKIKKWFKAKKYDDLFYLEDGLLKLNKEIAVNIKQIIPFEYDKMIKAIPAVVNDGRNNYEGILMLINSTSNSCELSINEIKTLHYILKKINLYEAGLMHLNYLGQPKVVQETNMTQIIQIIIKICLTIHLETKQTIV